MGGSSLGGDAVAPSILVHPSGKGSPLMALLSTLTASMYCSGEMPGVRIVKWSTALKATLGCVKSGRPIAALC